MSAALAQSVCPPASPRTRVMVVDDSAVVRGLVSRWINESGQFDVVGTAASVRLDTDNWTGHRFTDFFNLVKIDGQWKILSKVFYLHP